MQDWNQDGKVDAKDAAIFHSIIKNSGKEKGSSHRNSSSNKGKQKVSVSVVIAVLFLAAWISGSFPVNGLTGFLALICVIMIGYKIFN